MMIDGKGCALILALLAFVGLFLGLVAYFLGAPGSAVPWAMLGLPGAVALLFVLTLAWDAIKQRIFR